MFDDITTDLSKENKFDEIKAGKVRIQKGDRDKHGDLTVEHIQRALEDYGYELKRFGVDGKFGRETKGAVTKFQLINGLSSTGVVDSNTLILLDSPFANKSVSIVSEFFLENTESTIDSFTPDIMSSEREAIEGSRLDEDPYEHINSGNDLNRQDSSTALNAFADAIARRESGGRYDAENDESGAHGKYQIMPENWSRWARQAGLSRNAEKTPENQEIIARHKFRQYFNELGEWWLVAIKWYSGGGGVNRMRRLRKTDPSLTSARKSIRYRGGKTRYSGIASYADKVMKEYYTNMGQVYEGVEVYASSIQTSNKLYNLKEYLRKKGFKQEAFYLDKLLTTASEDEDSSENFTMPFGAYSTIHFDSDETLQAEITPTRQVTSSEETLNRNDIKIIKYIAGTEAERRGEGVRTAEGNIYEVIYKKKRAIAKVVPSINSEPDIWKKISEIEFTEEQKKYLPKIYDIIEDTFDTIIIMEVLEPFAGHMESILRTKRNRESEDLFKNEEFIHDAISRSFSKAIEELKDKAEDSEGESIYRAFVSEYESIRIKLERSMLIEETGLDIISEFVASELSSISNLFMLNNNSFISKIADTIQDNIKSYFQASGRPIPKYYSTEGVDETIGLLEERLQENAQGYSAGRNRRKLEALIKEREEAVYTESPEGFLYSEKYMPETEGLFSLLKVLKEHGINWSDVHTKNLMQRPGSREPVVIDVGLYELSQ